MAFFAIWWTWLNFTWFTSAYDNDDGIARLLTIFQILGSLVLAAGIVRFFNDDALLIIGRLRHHANSPGHPMAQGLAERPRTCAHGASIRSRNRVGPDRLDRFLLRAVRRLRPDVPGVGSVRIRGTDLVGEAGHDAVAPASHRGAVLVVLHHRSGRDDPFDHHRDSGRRGR